jgi:ABC-2 type transport system permease protein
MPLFLLAYGAIVTIPAVLSAKKEHAAKAYALVSYAPDLALPDSLSVPAAVHDTTDAERLASSLARSSSSGRNTMAGMLALGNVQFLTYADTALAQKDVVAGRLRGMFVLPADYVRTGRIWMYSRASESMQDTDVETDMLGRLLRRSVLGDRVTADAAERVITPIARTERFALDETGRVTAKGSKSWVTDLLFPLFFSVLLIIAIFGTSGSLLQGVAEEKENRVMEVLLSSATPWQLLVGKLVGLGAAGLLQLAVWLASGLLLSAGILPALLASGMSFHVPVHVWITCLALFLTGYLQYGALSLGFGSLGNTHRESQRLMMVFTMISMIPFILWYNIIEEPNGVLARTLSFIPLTAPVAMMLRLGRNAYQWWEPIVSILSILAGAFVALKVSAKLFRIGALLYGKRVTLPEILRWIRT